MTLGSCQLIQFPSPFPFSPPPHFPQDNWTKSECRRLRSNGLAQSFTAGHYFHYYVPRKIKIDQKIFTPTAKRRKRWLRICPAYQSTCLWSRLQRAGHPVYFNITSSHNIQSQPALHQLAPRYIWYASCQARRLDTYGTHYKQEVPLSRFFHIPLQCIRHLR